VKKQTKQYETKQNVVKRILLNEPHCERKQQQKRKRDDQNDKVEWRRLDLDLVAVAARAIGGALAVVVDDRDVVFVALANLRKRRLICTMNE
jgi:hypothetical protein